MCNSHTDASPHHPFRYKILNDMAVQAENVGDEERALDFIYTPKHRFFSQHRFGTLTRKLTDRFLNA